MAIVRGEVDYLAVANRMIERHYGALLDGAHAGIAGRLDAMEAEIRKTPPG